MDKNFDIDNKKADTRTAKHLLVQLQHTRAHLGGLLAKTEDVQGYKDSVAFCDEIEEAIKDVYFDTYNEELIKRD